MGKTARLRRFRRAAGLLPIAIAAALLGGGGALGQSAIQAVLEGQVVDRHGAPTPGVRITAHSPSVAMISAETLTDARGRYRIAPLPPADDYKVVAELAGFARVEASPVDLDPGKTTTQNFSLIPATELTEAIQVTAKGDIVDVASTKTTTVFSSEFIEGLPVMGRTYQDLLTLAPGVTDVDGDGNPNVNGARESSFQTRVDGANTTDPFTGMFGQNLNLEAIAEMEIITSGASAEFSQAQGGFANLITKSGGNDFQGSFKLFFRSDLFDNDGANNNDIDSEDLFAGLDGFKDVRPFLTLGGPILKDRLWYFVALESLALEQPVNTLTSPGLLTEDGWNNFGKLTWQATASHRLSLQVNHDPRRFTGLNLETGVAPESDFALEQGGYSVTGRWTYNIAPSVLLETLVSRLDTKYDLVPGADPEACVTDPAGRCDPFRDDLYTIDVRAGTVRGPYFQTSEDTRKRDSLRSDLSLFLDPESGSHNIKTGMELALESYDNRVRTRSVRFDDFLVCAPPPDVVDPDDLPHTDGFCDDADLNISLPNDPDDPPLIVGSITFEEAISSDMTRAAEKRNFGFYLQNSYRPVPNLAINVGLRLDREDATVDGWEMFDPAQQAEGFLDLLAVGQGVPRDSLDIASAYRDLNIQYDINGDGLDALHCFPFDLDGGALGDGEPDGAEDDFWTYYDGDFDGTVDPDNPFDFILQQPDGLPDGASVNPTCDRLSGDAVELLSTFSRHQLDDEVGRLFTAVSGEVFGTLRELEQFDIVNNNLAPRLSVSWDPWRNNKTKIFATWGRYYDRLFLGTLVPELGPDTRTQTFLATDRSFGADARNSQTGRYSVTQVDRNLGTPFSDEFTLGIERELAPEWSIGFTYIRRLGQDQLQDVDLNHFAQDQDGDGVFDDHFGRILIGIPPGDDGTDPIDVCFGDNPGGPQDCFFVSTSDGQPDLFAFNPFFNQVLRVGNFNSSDFTSYQLVLTRRLSRKWQMTSSYVFSEATGDAEEFISGLGNDPGTVDDEFGPLAFDRTHMLKFAGVAFLPFNQTIGGTVEWASGTPYSTILQRESADSLGSLFFRTTFPTEQRNDVRNEPFWTVNASYRKYFRFAAADASVGVEVQNVFNTDDFIVENVEPTQLLGLNATRRFGRRFQLSFEMHF